MVAAMTTAAVELDRAMTTATVKLDQAHKAAATAADVARCPEGTEEATGQALT